MNKIIFKALTGFGGEREVFFGAEDLEKVQYAFLREKRVLLSNGQAVDGKYIQQIMPDWIRTMGWNEGYSLTPDDNAEITKKGVRSDASHILEQTRDRVHFLLAQGRESEIGTDVSLPELDKLQIERRGGMKSIGLMLPKPKPPEYTPPSH